MASNTLTDKAAEISATQAQLAAQMQDFLHAMATQTSDGTTPFFITGLTIFVLACFVGYYVVWRVTPALHSPLMAVTNAISSVIIVGALIAVGLSDNAGPKLMGFLAVTLASVNIFGGFIVTRRMLQMFSKKKK
jgi:NAD(P) transhydrogenase subunit alpha